VPFLGRIPLVGELFRTRSGKRAQTNLMIFIRPKILTDGLQTSIESNSKYNAIRDVQQKQGSRFELIPLIPGDTKPLLPDLPPQPAAPAPAAPAVTPTPP